LLWPFVLAMVGVGAALAVLKTGRPTQLADQLIWIGLASAAGLILVLAVDLVKPRSDPFAEQEPVVEPVESEQRGASAVAESDSETPAADSETPAAESD
jgi:hypothetical protein